MAGAVRRYGDPDNPVLVEEDPDEVDHAVLSFFLHYWDEKRGGAAIPSASSFLPQEVRGHLRWLIVADALAQHSDFRYRVMGTSVCDYFLADSTGKTVSEAFAGTAYVADEIIRLYRRTCLLGRPIRQSVPSRMLDGTFSPAFDAIYLPYSTGGPIADRLVSAFVFDPAHLRKRRVAALAAPHMVV